MQEEESDASLVRRLQGGDVLAFDLLFGRYRRELLAFVVGLLGDRSDAEDVVQECFLQLVRRVRHIEAEKGAKGWLYRVARNRAIDRLRKRKWSVLPGLDFFRRCARHERAGDRTPSDGVARADLSDRLRRALDLLPEREREVLLLRYFSDLAFREIAEVVNRPMGTVLWQARRGLERLREMQKEADNGLF